MKTRNKVLIADDEAEFRADLQTAIEQNQYRVITASNKTQAQELVRRENPDLVILGTIAPRGDAFLFHQWLKRNSNFCKLPLIVIDASPDKQLIKGWTKDEGLRLDAEGYFCKPVKPEALLPFIEKLLDRTTTKIKILVVDDHVVAREGICTLLNLQKDIEVVGEAIDGKEAIMKTRQLAPDVVLMDIVMPVMDGLEATRQICKEYQDTTVLILSQYDDEDTRRAGYQAGAVGFIPKSSASSNLIADIRNASKMEGTNQYIGKN